MAGEGAIEDRVCGTCVMFRRMPSGLNLVVKSGGFAKVPSFIFFSDGPCRYWVNSQRQEHMWLRCSSVKFCLHSYSPWDFVFSELGI